MVKIDYFVKPRKEYKSFKIFRSSSNFYSYIFYVFMSCDYPYKLKNKIDIYEKYPK